MVKRIESGIAGKMLGFNALGFIRDLANQSRVNGAVFTKADGSIKVIAEGEEENLVAFTEKIK